MNARFFWRKQNLSRVRGLAWAMVAGCAVAAWTGPALRQGVAQEPPAAETANRQAELEAGLAKMLSGATLEGSFTNTGGRNSDELRRDRYTLGEVKKLDGKTWIIQAKIQYRDRDAVMIPLPLPIEWAGDTPVIVVDNFTIPGMGTFSARVMFYDDHYMGYWKHDDRGGHLFGRVLRADAPAPAAEKPAQ